MNTEWLPHIKDMAIEIKGPYTCYYDRPENKTENGVFDFPFYRVRFWSVAEHGDDLVVIMHDIGRGGIRTSPDLPEYESLLNEIEDIKRGKIKKKYSPVEKNYILKIIDLFEYAMDSIRKGIISKQIITWKNIKNVK